MTTGIPSLERIKSLRWTFAPLLFLELATDGTCAAYSSKGTWNGKTLMKREFISGRPISIGRPLMNDILNAYFSTIGEKLAMDFPVHIGNKNEFIKRVTPTKMNIDLSFGSISKIVEKIKANKACGPDSVAPKLIKKSDDTIIPSLMPIYLNSIAYNAVPQKWKFANVAALYKKEDEADKQNYRPISLLCVPGKIMESCVVSSISTHVVENELAHRNQWAYKQGHSTEMLLIKMTEDWRKALDNNLVVGIVLVDFRKAFDSISHDVLMLKLQGLGISGDLWSWILDYLSNRSQVTVVNGTKSEAMPIKFGVPQGSVLGPTLFSLFCNDLPDVAENDGIIHMFADDTTMYAIGPSVDSVTISLNNMLGRLYDWCCCNCLTPHPGKYRKLCF